MQLNSYYNMLVTSIGLLSIVRFVFHKHIINKWEGKYGHVKQGNCYRKRLKE